MPAASADWKGRVSFMAEVSVMSAMAVPAETNSPGRTWTSWTTPATEAAGARASASWS